MNRRTRGALAALLAAGWICSCSAAPASPKATAAGNPFVLDEAPESFRTRPRLLGRLLASPHSYFRYINLKFEREVCHRFANEIRTAPQVNLHGDAHLEQYAVTDLGRGLTDFDDSSRGPAVVDLVRFIASLHLAAEASGREAHARELVDSFLRGYEQGLADPDKEITAPALARRIAAAFSDDRSTLLTGADELMQKLDIPVAAIQRALDRYAKPHKKKQQITANYFRVKSAGRLTLGIGSARDRKYLVRIEGGSNEQTDDVVLELKEVRNLGDVPCLDGTLARDPFRILVGSARIAYRPFELLGYTELDGATFWIHAWTDNYAPVVIDSSFRSSREMAEVAFDAGVQLGRGHPYLVATPLDAELRDSLLRWQRTHEGKIRREGAALAALVTEAWREFSAVLTRRRTPVSAGR